MHHDDSTLNGPATVLGDALKAPRYLLPTLRSVGIVDGLRFFTLALGHLVQRFGALNGRCDPTDCARIEATKLYG